MLNKVLIGTIVNFVLQILNHFFPGVVIPEGFSEILITLIVFLAQFFTKETAMTVAKLVLK
jgi:hypothetical protein